MKGKGLISGWRDFSLAVGARLGVPVGVGRLRWVVESSGLPIGNKVGGVLLFDEADAEKAVDLMRERLCAEAARPSKVCRGDRKA